MTLAADCARAARQLLAAPAFAVPALLSLAVGVAATSSIVSLAEALLLPSRGLQAPGELVEVGRGMEGRGFDNMSHPAFTYLREHTTTLAGIAAHELGGQPLSVTLGPTSERAFGMVVSGNYFDVLGTRMALGRGFRADEDVTPGARPVVVVSHRFWTRRLGADPAVLSRPLNVNTMAFAVVGVAEPGFEGVSFVGADLWVPSAMVAAVRGLETPALLTDPRSVWHLAIGRRRPGVSVAEVDAELDTLMAQYLAATPAANPRHTITVAPATRLPGPMRTPFLAFIAALFALTLAFLAIACSNVGGLLLARAAARRREMATRLALGASRGRLLAQLLTETAVLFATAGVLALPLTVAGVRWLGSTVDAGLLPVLLNVSLAVSPRVVAFALTVALGTAVIFGLAPARHALASNLAPLLHGTTTTGDRGRRRGRQILVAAQVALAVMLVVTAGLFVRSLANAARTDPGFSTDDITLVTVDLALSGYRGDALTEVSRRVQARLAGLPGVSSVATSRMIPLQGGGFGLGRLRVPGLQGPTGDDVVDADWNVVSPEYFATIAMRLVEGRTFLDRDDPRATRVAIVNETFARQAWPGRPAVGQRLLHRVDDTHEEPIEVVGIARDAKYRYISDGPAPHIYVPAAQHPLGEVTFFVRRASASPPVAEVRRAVAQVDAGIAVLLVQPFDEAAALGLLPQRVTAWIAGLVGAAGALLAAFGLYGVMAYLVTQRTREMAIRLALGASAGAIRRLVLQDATVLFTAGALAGVALAAGIATALGSLLVGVGPHDALTYGGTLAVFGVVLGVAAYLPARRAAATDPARTLRAE